MVSEGKLFCAVLLIFVSISCSKDDPVGQTQYIIASASDGNSVLSIYGTESGQLTDLPFKIESGDAEILDILLVPKGLFVILKNGIRLLDPTDWSVASSTTQTFSDPSYIAYSKRRLYAVVYEKNASYLRIYDESSLALLDNQLIGPDRVYALTVVQNRIFISYNKSVVVLDADDLGKIGELELASISSTFLVDSQNNVLVFYDDKCTKIFNSESRISSFNLPGARTLSTATLRPSAVIDRETDILYFFNALPGSVQLTLASFDLRKNVAVSILPSYFLGEAIYFDQKSKHILLSKKNGNEGKVMVITTDGKAVVETSFLGKPIKIVTKFY